MLGGAIVVLLLLLSFVVDVIMGLAAMGTARVPLLWLFQWHPVLILVALVSLAWQWRDRSVWLFALGIAGLPFAALALTSWL
ncbi:hypothetical protein [Phenylobacterium sp.]|uniref:hypothetical protein n=1 Tax=Phenylobacterium sp. TaxID=1871053 RepID=UPI0039192DEC